MECVGGGVRWWRREEGVVREMREGMPDWGGGGRWVGILDLQFLSH